ncbi:MAG TPA: PDZ domain-containing protein [Granulicella sp.]
MNDVTPENASFFHLNDASGAIVAQVTPDSPASQAGLQRGDVIVQLDGKKIVSSSDLQMAVSQMQPGTGIALGILRDGSQKTLSLKVGEFHGNAEVASNSDGSDNHGKLGLAVDDLTDDVRQQLRLPGSVHGVAVEQVRPGSPAEDAGLQPGDVIVEVNRQPVPSAQQFADKVHANPADKDMLLTIWSKGNESYRVVHPSQG